MARIVAKPTYRFLTLVARAQSTAINSRIRQVVLSPLSVTVRDSKGLYRLAC